MDALLNRLYVVRLALYIIADKLIGVHVHIHTHTHKLIYAYKKKCLNSCALSYFTRIQCPILKPKQKWANLSDAEKDEIRQTYRLSREDEFWRGPETR